MTHALRRVALFAAVLVLCATGCRRPPPSVLLISIDSLRYDDAFGDVAGKPVMPRLRAFARQSVTWERAYASAPWTTPSMMAVMTGLPAPAHGVEEHDRALASTVSTLAERFRARGYATAAFVPEVTLRPEFGFGRGFDQYVLDHFGHAQVCSPTQAGRVQNALASFARGGQPFFVWVHLWDPHYNYLPPPPYDVAFPAGRRPASEDLQCLKWGFNAVAPDEAAYLRGKYRGELQFTDRWLGEILDGLAPLGLEDRTVVAVIGDHGEAFQEHGWLTHTNRVDEEVIHVPLAVRAPGGALAPATVQATVGTAQLGATLLGLAGGDATGFGRLAPLPLSGTRENVKETAGGPAVLSETIRQGCFTALVSGTSKYVLDHRTCAESVFDVAADPREQHDLAPGNPSATAALRGRLAAALADIRAARIPRAAMPAAVVEEAQAALRSLGYVGGGTPGKAGYGCALAPAGQHDTFGDAAASACPQDGAAACLARLSGTAPRSPSASR